MVRDIFCLLVGVEIGWLLGLLVQIWLKLKVEKEDRP